MLIAIKKLENFDPKQPDGNLMEISLSNDWEGPKVITGYENHPLLIRDFIEFLKRIDGADIRISDETGKEKSS